MAALLINERIREWGQKHGFHTFENHTFRMVDRTAGKDIKVPSNMYPLNREAQLFTTETTDTISDAHVREIVNCIDGRMNNTYQNAEQVVRTPVTCGWYSGQCRRGLGVYVGFWPHVL
ncbi:MAG: hypothetical protein ACLUW8_01755 [Subdoligranulum sp.]